MMQIQPSNVSHLLSGRNKPSLDFLIKLKDVFPEYSFDWIILGKKPITVSERSQIAKDDVLQTVDLFHTIEASSVDDDGLIDMVEENKSNAMDDKMDKPVHSKKVTQIVYIYEDHTFDIYHAR